MAMLSRKIFGVSQYLGLTLNSFSYTQRMFVHHHKEAHDLIRFLGIKRSNRARANRNTHINERRFQRPRGQKLVAIELPEDSLEQKMREMTPLETRIYLLKKGTNPYKHMQPRNWSEHQITFDSCGDVLNNKVLPEEFLKGSIPEKGAEFKERVLNRWHNWKNGTSRMRKKEGFEKFNVKTFGPTADTIYLEAHKALLARDKALIHRYLTENAFQKMWPDVENGTVVWELLKQVEPSKVISVRCGDIPVNTGNDIAQLTVRMHTVQKLAIYDRFGHLILGSETECRPVLEYVVFENHIASVDGVWRLHDKLYPNWSTTKQPIKLTSFFEPEETLPDVAEACKKTSSETS